MEHAPAGEYLTDCGCGGLGGCLGAVARPVPEVRLRTGSWPDAFPLLYVMRKRSARSLRRFEELFPDSLEFVARSMRAGHARFQYRLEMIHRGISRALVRGIPAHF